MPKPAGTYQLKSGPFFYIGSSTNLEQRKRDHLWRLRANIHRCTNIQKAFNQSGECSFTPIQFLKKSPVESDSEFRDRLRAAEQSLINEQIGDQFFENKSIYARHSGLGGAALQKLWQDPETRKIMIERLKARTSNPSPETREKMSRAKRGINNPNSRPVIVTHPDGSTQIFPSTSEAAAFFQTSQQLFDTWIKKTAPWPGTGKFVRAKYAWITNYSAQYLI